MLIAAISGRALAQAAQRAGLLPLTADFFGDLDTNEAGPSVVVDGDFAAGFAQASLLSAMDRLADGHNPIGVVFGSGFEQAPGLLDELSRRWPVKGNDAAVIALLKDPAAFARLSHSLGIPHPPTQAEPPKDPHGWLSKMQGASGGMHVQPAATVAGEPDERCYFQKRVEGEAVSALFVANGKGDAVIAGFSRQWVSPAPGLPYRYGGALRPAPLAATIEQDLREAVNRIAAAVPIKGLNSADFLVDANGFHLIEINPRPGATLDIFESLPLFRWHIEGCDGHLPRVMDAPAGADAAAIVYTDRDIAAMPELDWPAWTRDRQRAGSIVPQGYPICTVCAGGDSPVEALRLIKERSTDIVLSIDRRTS